MWIAAVPDVYRDNDPRDSPNNMNETEKLKLAIKFMIWSGWR